MPAPGGGQIGVTITFPITFPHPSPVANDQLGREAVVPLIPVYQSTRDWTDIPLSNHLGLPLQYSLDRLPNYQTQS